MPTDNTLSKSEEPDSSPPTSVYAAAAYNVIAAMRKALQEEAAQLTADQMTAESAQLDPFMQEENENYILVLVKNFFVERSPRPHHLGDTFVEHFLGIRDN